MASRGSRSGDSRNRLTLGRWGSNRRSGCGWFLRRGCGRGHCSRGRGRDGWSRWSRAGDLGCRRCFGCRGRHFHRRGRGKLGHTGSHLLGGASAWSRSVVRVQGVAVAKALRTEQLAVAGGAEWVVFVVHVAIALQHSLAAVVGATTASKAVQMPDVAHGHHLFHLVHRLIADGALRGAVECHRDSLGGILDRLGFLFRHKRCLNILQDRLGYRRRGSSWCRFCCLCHDWLRRFGSNRRGRHWWSRWGRRRHYRSSGRRSGASW
mmetsp:Transcript_29480/g.50562  ORF Transcript_29480/g.50562 Transcript_29480/m.50562 type:complete len:264 (-) Transcript_29480:480-1271(-)